MTAVSEPAAPARLRSGPRLAIALGTVYVVWGSTYLGIRWTVAELPPLMSGAMRFLVAGAGFLLVSRVLGYLATVTRRQIASAAVVGALMPGLCNGLVSIAERHVSSSLTALTLAVMPLWLALLQAVLRLTGRGLAHDRPGPLTIAGLLIGFAGTALLVWHGEAGGRASAGGLALLLVTSLVWAATSLYARQADRPSPWVSTCGFEMLAGGLLQLLLGLARGELPLLLAAHPGGRAIGSLVYLTVIGAWAGYGAFSWLTGHASPTLVATYAYVNPLVAVLLGWALAGESLGPRTLVAGALIVCSVVLVTARRAGKSV